MADVIIELTGGLGNQMFQYAAGLSLAVRHNAGLKLDLSETTRDADRPFLLRHFRVDEPEADPSEIATLDQGNSRWRRKLIGSLPAVAPLVATKRYRQPDFRFDPQFAAFRPPVLVSGLFQSEKFFADHAALVRDRFELRTPLKRENAARLDRIRRADHAVAVHVRRGDYVSNAAANALMGVCDPAYYRAAADAVTAKLGAKPTFFAFSDEPEWVRANFAFLGDVEVISGNGAEPWADIALMSAAKSLIIANSTFSWWGAWLARNPHIVMAPATWFRHNEKGKRRTDDLYPANWTRLPNGLV